MATAEDQHDAHADAADAHDDPARETATDEHRDPRDDTPHEKKGRLDFFPDIVRRTFYAGLGAVFTTEEGIRKLTSELKLPKDVANYVIQQAASSKDELLRVVGKELRGFLETVNISGELQKLLTSLSFEIKTEIRFIPNDEAISGVKPDVKVGRFSFRRNRDDDKKKRDKEGNASHPKEAKEPGEPDA